MEHSISVEKNIGELKTTLINLGWQEQRAKNFSKLLVEQKDLGLLDYCLDDDSIKRLVNYWLTMHTKFTKDKKSHTWSNARTHFHITENDIELIKDLASMLTYIFERSVVS